MARTKRCGLCGRSADEADLIWLRGLRGAVCRPGRGCDKAHPALSNVRLWLAADTKFTDAELDDFLVDNPK
jgi:hypothetical protein